MVRFVIRTAGFVSFHLLITAEAPTGENVCILVCVALSEQELSEARSQPPFLWPHESDQLCITIFHRSCHLFSHWPLPCTLLWIYAESCCCHVYVPVADAFLQMVAKVAQARPPRVLMAPLDMDELDAEQRAKSTDDRVQRKDERAKMNQGSTPEPKVDARRG